MYDPIECAKWLTLLHSNQQVSDIFNIVANGIQSSLLCQLLKFEQSMHISRCPQRGTDHNGKHTYKVWDGTKRGMFAGPTPKGMHI